MRLPRHSEAWREKFRSFQETFGTSTKQAGGSILCPCAQCQGMKRCSDMFQIHLHLVSKGFVDCYISEFEGQQTSSSAEGHVDPGFNPDLNLAITKPEDEQPIDDDVGNDEAVPPYFGEDDEEDISDDPAATNTMIRNIISASIHGESQDDKPNRDAEIFLKLLEEAKKELYPRCKAATKVSFIMQLFHIKCMYGISNTCLEAILKLFSRILHEGHCILDSLDKVQKVVRDLGLDYVKIHACKNDCVLFFKENEKL